MKRFKVRDESEHNKKISLTFKELVNSMKELSSPYIVPYLACIEADKSVLCSMPLCTCNLGEHIAHLAISQNLQWQSKDLAKQVRENVKLITLLY